ncbi:MAG: glycosyltransferase family 4 protein [Bacteroidales bacterium]|jgi:glycosyltransferase involved in cell wall biosynthesis|nr:glycosyltransferase family 4 protein [Bacteroidales bacterium]
MKINILSAGRAHLLDIARELDKKGFDVKFYSFVPTKRAMKFGLQKKCSKSLFSLLFPFVYLAKARPFSRSRFIRHGLRNIQDFITSIYMRPADITVVLSAEFKISLKKAKRQGSITIVECGSKHVIEQHKIISVDRIKFSKSFRRELEAYISRTLNIYNEADYITIPSKHVKESFLKQNFPEQKLFVNPYGASLKRFYPTDKPGIDSYDVIMVGQWSWRKGCDMIVEAIRKLNIRFLHVGALYDLPFPENENLFTHVNSVDETQLVQYYNQAKVFVLPSREEGLALVQAQALACGLPIVCSKDTGGRDLRDFLTDKKWIIEMQETTAECLADCIKEALALADIQPEGKRDYAGNDINQLTWEANGKRYGDFLIEIRNLQ